MIQQMSDENIDALVHYRLERAHQTLAEIPFLREQGYYTKKSTRYCIHLQQTEKIR